MACHVGDGIVNADGTELLWEINHTYNTTDCDSRFHTQIDGNTCLSACPGDSEYDKNIGKCYVDCEEKYNGAKPFLDNNTSTCLNYVEYHSITDSEDVSVMQILASQHNSPKIDCGAGTENPNNPFIPCVCPDGYQRRT